MSSFLQPKQPDLSASRGVDSTPLPLWRNTRVSWDGKIVGRNLARGPAASLLCGRLDVLIATALSKGAPVPAEAHRG